MFEISLILSKLVHIELIKKGIDLIFQKLRTLNTSFLIFIDTNSHLFENVYLAVVRTTSF